MDAAFFSVNGNYVGPAFVLTRRNPIFVRYPKSLIVMKKVLAIVVIAAIVSSCSTYTCPTYSKKDVKKNTVENKI